MGRATARHRIVKGDQLWRHERQQARWLGCNLEVKTEGHTAYARLTPITQTTRQAFKTAAAQAGHAGRDSIEARQAFTGPGDQAAAIHAAITSVLRLACDVAS